MKVFCAQVYEGHQSDLSHAAGPSREPSIDNEESMRFNMGLW